MWPFGKQKEQKQQDAVDQYLEREKRANEAAQVFGRHYVDWVEPIKELKRQGNVAEAERILSACVDAAERECAVQHMGVAPWYYEELASLFRQQKRYGDEVAILERFAKQQHAPGASPERLKARLVKAKELYAKSNT